MNDQVDIDDRCEFLADPDAEPVDIDETLAEFLLRYVQTTNSPSAGASAVDGRNSLEA